MKKVVLSLLVALSLLIVPNVKAVDDLPTITDHEKVTVYLFRSSTCINCQNFLEYFSENYYQYQDYFDIVSFEVNQSGNYELVSLVKERFNVDHSGVPYIVVGNNWDQLGFGSNGEAIINAALDAYEDESYTDLVAEIIEEEGLDVTSETLEEAAASHGFEVVGLNGEDPNAGLSDGAIVAIIFGILILGFGGLIIYSRKK